MRIIRIGRANVIASLWGFAEATLFFIVPDVLLSWLALRSRRTAFLACLYALAGALVGGTAMWVWGRFDPQTARQLIASLPAIDTAIIASAHQQLADHGIVGCGKSVSKSMFSG